MLISKREESKFYVHLIREEAACRPKLETLSESRCLLSLAFLLANIV